MDYRASRLQKELRSYDPQLFVVKASNGMLQVWRKPDSLNLANLYADERPKSAQLILPITDDWTLKGRPVEWGIDPILRKISSMDAWRDDSGYDKFVKRREQAEQERVRVRSNENRARANDLRKDIARVTNDYRMGGN